MPWSQDRIPWGERWDDPGGKDPPLAFPSNQPRNNVFSLSLGLTLKRYGALFPPLFSNHASVFKPKSRVVFFFGLKHKPTGGSSSKKTRQPQFSFGIFEHHLFKPASRKTRRFQKESPGSKRTTPWWDSPKSQIASCSCLHVGSVVYYHHQYHHSITMYLCFIYVFIHLFIYLYIYLFMYLCFYLFMCLFFMFCLFIYLFIY